MAFDNWKYRRRRRGRQRGRSDLSASVWSPIMHALVRPFSHRGSHTHTHTHCRQIQCSLTLWEANVMAHWLAIKILLLIGLFLPLLLSSSSAAYSTVYAWATYRYFDDCWILMINTPDALPDVDAYSQQCQITESRIFTELFENFHIIHIFKRPWSSGKMSISRQISTYWFRVCFLVCSASETWIVKAADVRKLLAFEMRCYRRILNVCPFIRLSAVRHQRQRNSPHHHIQRTVAVLSTHNGVIQSTPKQADFVWGRLDRAPARQTPPGTNRWSETAMQHVNIYYLQLLILLVHTKLLLGDWEPTTAERETRFFRG